MPGNAILGSCVLQQQQQQPGRPWQQQQQQQQQQQHAHQGSLLPLLCPVSVAAAFQPCRELSPSLTLRFDGDIDIKANPKHFPTLEYLSKEFSFAIHKNINNINNSNNSSSNNNGVDVLFVRPFLSAEALRLLFAVPPRTPQLSLHQQQLSPHRSFGIPSQIPPWSGAYKTTFAPSAAAAATTTDCLRQQQQQLQQQQQQQLLMMRRHQQQQMMHEQQQEQREDSSCSSEEGDYCCCSDETEGFASAAASVSSLYDPGEGQEETLNLAPASIGCLFDLRQMPRYSLHAYREVYIYIYIYRERERERERDRERERER